MRQLKIGLVLALAIILHSSIAKFWPAFVYADLPLIVVIYFALQRDILQALVIGAIAGLGMDALSAGGLLGAGGFSKTVVAYLVCVLAMHVMLDNPLLRIPVLACAAALDALIYVLLHRIFGQPTLFPFVEKAAFKLIWTTIAGTIILQVLDIFFSERANQRRQFAFRRRVARRSIGGMRKSRR